MPKGRVSNPPRTVYKAKRASSVGSAFLWEPSGTRVEWAGWAPGGDGRESATLALSSRNLSNSAGNKLICEMHSWGFSRDIFSSVKGGNEWNFTHFTHLSYWSLNTFTGHSFLWGIPFLLGREKHKIIHTFRWELSLMGLSLYKFTQSEKNPYKVAHKGSINHASFHSFCTWGLQGTFKAYKSTLQPPHAFVKKARIGCFVYLC